MSLRRIRRGGLAILLLTLAATACTGVLGIHERELDGAWECYEGCDHNTSKCTSCTLRYHKEICENIGFIRALSNFGYDGCRPVDESPDCSGCALCIERCACQSVVMGDDKTDDDCAMECEGATTEAEVDRCQLTLVSP